MHGVTDTDIKSLHANITVAIKSVTRASLQTVSPSHHDAWPTASVGSKIDFELTTIRNRNPNVLHEMVDREIGGRTFAFRLIEEAEEEPTLWAGWYEQWESAPDGLFNLIGLSWTFYWGVLYRPKKAILRAEWDSLRYRSERAAQPHWHIDPDLLVESYRRIPVNAPTTTPVAPPSAGGLIELPPEDVGLREILSAAEVQELSLKGMHLAMGGWEHAESHPNCWRYALPTRWNDITKWLERTLTYAREQFVNEFRSSDPV